MCAQAAINTKLKKKIGSLVAYKTIDTFLSQNVLGHLILGLLGPIPLHLRAHRVHLTVWSGGHTPRSIRHDAAHGSKRRLGSCLSTRHAMLQA